MGLWCQRLWALLRLLLCCQIALFGERGALYSHPLVIRHSSFPSGLHGSSLASTNTSPQLQALLLPGHLTLLCQSKWFKAQFVVSPRISDFVYCHDVRTIALALTPVYTHTACGSSSAALLPWFLAHHLPPCPPPGPSVLGGAEVALFACVFPAPAHAGHIE